MMPRRARGSAVAIALYLVLVFLSFLPQSLRPGDTIAYVGDSLESVYIVAWNVHQLFRSPAHLFEANVLYPHPRALAFTDHRLLPSLAVAPVLWATGNAVLATNLVGDALRDLLDPRLRGE
jgi:ABC-type dipeptide/oligopeptide/nickel transport system permease component